MYNVLFPDSMRACIVAFIIAAFNAFATNELYSVAVVYGDMPVIDRLLFDIAEQKEM